jgi:uncharacterized Zn finger protein
VLVCEACGHEGCKADLIDDPDWWAIITCPACGHVRMIGAKTEWARERLAETP